MKKKFDIELCLKQKNDGYTQKELATYWGVSYMCIHKRIRKYEKDLQIQVNAFNERPKVDNTNYTDIIDLQNQPTFKENFKKEAQKYMLDALREIKDERCRVELFKALVVLVKN